MRLVVFGATGGTGRAVVEQALARGDDVAVLARRPERLGLEHARLRVVAGDAFDAASVAAVVRDRDGVISALGTRPWRHTDVCSAGATNIIAGMRAHGVRRLVCVSSLGAAESIEQTGWVSRWLFFKTVLRRAMADKTVMEERVRASDLDWVLVRPVILTSGRARGRVRAVVDGSIRGGTISRADVAAFCLEQLGRDEWLRQAPVIAG